MHLIWLEIWCFSVESFWLKYLSQFILILLEVRTFKIQTYICVLSWINITDRQLLLHNTLQQTKRTTGQWTLLSGHYWNWNNLDSHHENLRITNNLNNPISGHKMSVIYLKMQHKCKYDFENTCFKKYQTDCLQVQLETELLLL